MIAPQLDCFTCTHSQKVARGCETEAKTAYKYGDDTFKRCPRRIFYEEMEGYNDLIWSYVNFRDRSIMPDAGGMMDQPNDWVEMIQVIDGAFNEGQKVLNERNK